jgi:hydrogenase nickel incorporation protein HypB
VVVVNKMDIAGPVGFDRDTAVRNIRRVAPEATILEVSARTGQGMAQWYAYLEERRHREKGHSVPHPQGPAPA